MKKWVKIALWSLFLAAVVSALIIAQKTVQESLLTAPAVTVQVEGENAFLTQDEIVARLRKDNYLFSGQRVKDLNVEAIEKNIASMEEIKSVRVFTHLNGTWEIVVELKKPILRIYNKFGQDFFLDSDGTTVSSSREHIARVMIATGEIPDKLGQENVAKIINNDTLKTIRKIDDLYRISKYVCNDPLMQSLIGQIHLENNGDFVLIPLIGGQKIIFGSAYTDEEVKEKFEKLKIFYNEAIPFEGWNKYSEVSLKFKDQIVCKRKE